MVPPPCCAPNKNRWTTSEPSTLAVEPLEVIPPVMARSPPASLIVPQEGDDLGSLHHEFEFFRSERFATLATPPRPSVHSASLSPAASPVVHSVTYLSPPPQATPPASLVPTQAPSPASTSPDSPAVSNNVYVEEEATPSLHSSIALHFDDGTPFNALVI
ncbi:lysine-rich arabinogalactan protein 19-like [Malania oleifera]|uniref:lysine-rich arabinogalactan protein 19-like n=1 Tax=Malania oleifera TaxID=397392 RepID=UPI0025ADD9E7|nr:lysine-rich arabinogalactan protein 19-like [Malania oleifera]